MLKEKNIKHTSQNLINVYALYLQDAKAEREVYQTAVVQAREEMSTHRRHDRPVTPVSADLNKVRCYNSYIRLLFIMNLTF